MVDDPELGGAAAVDDTAAAAEGEEDGTDDAGEQPSGGEESDADGSDSDTDEDLDIEDAADADDVIARLVPRGAHGQQTTDEHEVAGTDAGGGDGDDHSSGNTARVEGATSEAEGAAGGDGVLFEVGGGEDGDSVDAEVGGVDDDADEGADDAEEGSDDDDANGDESGEPEKQEEDPSGPAPRGRFFMHDDRYEQKGNRRRRKLYEPKGDVFGKAWVHDKFDELNALPDPEPLPDRGHRGRGGKRSARGRGRGRGRERAQGPGPAQGRGQGHQNGGGSAANDFPGLPILHAHAANTSTDMQDTGGVIDAALDSGATGDVPALQGPTSQPLGNAAAQTGKKRYSQRRNIAQPAVPAANSGQAVPPVQSTLPSTEESRAAAAQQHFAMQAERRRQQQQMAHDAQIQGGNFVQPHHMYESFEVMTVGGEKQIVHSPTRMVQHGINPYYVQGQPQGVGAAEYDYYQQQVPPHNGSPNHAQMHQAHNRQRGGYSPYSPQQMVQADYGMAPMMAYDPVALMGTSPMKASAPAYTGAMQAVQQNPKQIYKSPTKAIPILDSEPDVPSK